jgi:hypothetical protein
MALRACSVRAAKASARQPAHDRELRRNLMLDKETQEIQNRRAMWANELTSRKFVQGTIYLKTTGKDLTSQYCCLGVACEVFGPQLGVYEVSHGYDEVTDYRDSVLFKVKETGDVVETFLPSVLRHFFGLSKNSERILAKLNDSRVSFETIADILYYLPVETDLEDD